MRQPNLKTHMTNVRHDLLRFSICQCQHTTNLKAWHSKQGFVYCSQHPLEKGFPGIFPCTSLILECQPLCKQNKALKLSGQQILVIKKQCLVPCVFFPEFPCSIQIAHLRCYVFQPLNFIVFSHFLPSCKIDGDIWSLGIKTFFTEERAVLSGCFYILRRFLLVFVVFWAPFLRVSIYEFSGEGSFILKKHTDLEIAVVQ